MKDERMKRRNLLTTVLLLPFAPLLKWLLSRKPRGMVWTGCIDGNWSDPRNWSLGIVPRAGDNVIVGPSRHHLLYSTEAAKAGSITIDGGGITINGGDAVFCDALYASNIYLIRDKRDAAPRHA